ncbi:transmembrane emp24 domain-containing protein p24delta3-like [Bidens hawaiensis]|uniref:transmembrane emp24 domain-containing protein p24delta3-like n=1 Tax=Bidens hawaiensis TaxID=980011 RepID=UPI004049859D
MLLLMMLLLIQNGKSVWLNLPKSGYKCVMEELHNNVVVVGEYNVVIFEGLVLAIQPAPSRSSKNKSPHGNLIYHKENVTEDEFAFTSTESGSYLTCFLPDNPDTGGKFAVNIDWKIRASAKDWDSVAKKEKIEMSGVELELRKLKGHVEAIRDNLVYRKSREANMREVSETTNSRVTWYSLSSLGICILASVHNYGT